MNANKYKYQYEPERAVSQKMSCFPNYCMIDDYEEDQITLKTPEVGSKKTIKLESILNVTEVTI